MKTREQLQELYRRNEAKLAAIVDAASAGGWVASQLSPRPNRRRFIESKSGVYFLEWGGFIKIGSAFDVVARARVIEYGIPFGAVERVAWYPVFPCLKRGEAWYWYESQIHQRFEADRERGEWFKDTPRLRQFIDRHGYPWPE